MITVVINLVSYFEARNIMATIRKLKSCNYQVQIHLSGLKPITKTFRTKTLATSFQRKVEGDKKLQLALGDLGTSGITLGELIDEYMKQYPGKDHGLPTSLTWWKNYCGELVVNKCTVSVIRKGINQLAEGHVLIGNGRGKTKGKTKELARKRSGATVNKRYDNVVQAYFLRINYISHNWQCRTEAYFI